MGSRSAKWPATLERTASPGGAFFRHEFGRLVAVGLAGNLFLYVFINMAMVMGLIPVVGVPLPLISYGGTAMLTVLVGFGLIMSVYINRDLRIGRRGGVAED